MGVAAVAVVEVTVVAMVDATTAAGQSIDRADVTVAVADVVVDGVDADVLLQRVTISIFIVVKHKFDALLPSLLLFTGGRRIWQAT